MRINNNLMAMNTHRMLSINNQNTSKSVEKLSSGLRINRAGDDAAGLSISEKMRAQIKGLNQASRNAQDAISLIQTGEGALNETHALLQRGRELMVQGSTDSLTASDRGKIQTEISSIMGEVDNISRTTEFNTQKLLSTSTISESRQAAITTLNTEIPNILDDSLTALRDNFGIALPDSPTKRSLKIEYYEGGSTGAAASMGTSDGGASLTLRVNLDQVLDGSDSIIADVDRLVAHETMHAMQFTEMDFSTDGSMPAGEIWMIEGLAMTVQGGVGFGTIDGSSTIGGAWTGSLQNYSDAFTSIKVLHEITTDGLGAFIDELEAGGDLDTAFANTVQGDSVEGGASQILNGAGDINSLSDFITWYNGTDVDAYLNNSTDFAGTGAITDASTQGDYTSVNSAATIVNDADSNLTDTHFNISYAGLTDGDAKSELVFHIGANSGQSLTLELANTSSAALGLSDLSAVS
jgi:flagellin